MTLPGAAMTTRQLEGGRGEGGGGEKQRSCERGIQGREGKRKSEGKREKCCERRKIQGRAGETKKEGNRKREKETVGESGENELTDFVHWLVQVESSIFPSSPAAVHSLWDTR